MICGFFVSMLSICRSMFRNVVAALNEALDITMHLKPLTEHFEVCINKSCLRERKSVRLCLNCIISFQALEGTDFTDVRPLFPPMMHTICLVYSHSKYFNSAARIIVLMTVSQYMSR